MVTWHTAGESHGRALIALAEGVPAGVRISSEDFAAALARRRLGYGRGARQKFEKDEITILGGIRHGVTMGSPVAVMIGNSEWPRWEEAMNPDPIGYEPSATGRGAPLTRPRPGHADLAGMLKYGHSDIRPVLERASARETAARVVLGTLAEAILDQVAGVSLVSHVLSIGTVAADDDAPLPRPTDVAALDAAEVRTLDHDLDQRFVQAIDDAKADANTIGGTVEVVAYDVPIGLGTYAQGRDRLDARLAGAVMSIQAVKGVEIGDGFASAARLGSHAHDEISQEGRATNRAGGIEGGISNGLPVVVRAAFKPISSVPRALSTVDAVTGEAAAAINQRSDTCAVVPGAVITQAVVAMELATALLEKTGGDSVAEASRNLQAYTAELNAILRDAAAAQPGE